MPVYGLSACAGFCVWHDGRLCDLHFAAVFRHCGAITHPPGKGDGQGVPGKAAECGALVRARQNAPAKCVRQSTPVKSKCANQDAPGKAASNGRSVDVPPAAARAAAMYCLKGLWPAACGPQAADVPAAARAACAASGALYPGRSGQGRATANNFRPGCGGQYQ